MWLKSSAFWAARDIALRIRPGFFRRVKRLLKESRDSGFRKARSDAFELLTGGETIETIQKRPLKPCSIPYYIDKVIDYRTQYETAKKVENSYLPVVVELLPSILISVRALRGTFGVLSGFLLFLLLKPIFSA